MRFDDILSNPKHVKSLVIFVVIAVHAVVVALLSSSGSFVVSYGQDLC